MSHLYRFGPYVLDPQRRTLYWDESPVPLTPKAFDVLLFLAQNPNRLITKDELLKAVWGDTFVEEGNLTQYISHLRKALADNSENSRLIVTISRKGYQFTADVVLAESADSPKRDCPDRGCILILPPERGCPSRSAVSVVRRLLRLGQPRSCAWERVCARG